MGIKELIWFIMFILLLVSIILMGTLLYSGVSILWFTITVIVFLALNYYLYKSGDLDSGKTGATMRSLFLVMLLIIQLLLGFLTLQSLGYVGNNASLISAWITLILGCLTGLGMLFYI